MRSGKNILVCLNLMPCQRATILNTEYQVYNGLHFNSGIAELAGFEEVIPATFVICNHRTCCDKLILELKTKTYMLYGNATAFSEAVKSQDQTDI